MTRRVSVVVPVLNEMRLEELAAAIVAAVPDVEILFVDDGDLTASRALQQRHPGVVRVIEGRHRGKGAAVRAGLLATEGDIAILLDADLESVVPRLAEFTGLIARDGYDVVIGERPHDWRARHPLRFLLSYGLYLAQRLFVFQSFRFSDTQCGLKAFRGSAARELASRQRVEGGMYDIEYLYIASRNGMKIAQVPIGRPAETRPSRISLISCLWRDPAALAGVKWRGLTGRYRITPAK